MRKAVTEYNECLSEAFGYHVELVGWEDTVSRFGRPQHLINEEVDRCDLFLGMIWKKWGTPPDTEGTYSSGFEEEFDRSLVRRDETRSPEISLYFKHVPDDNLTDPGSDLKKVLTFRERVIAAKKLLFQEFHTPQDMERLARRCIIDYITRITKIETTLELNDTVAEGLHVNVHSDLGAPKNPKMSPVSAEGFTFLSNMVDRIGHEGAMDDLTTFDVARFRLLANSISKPGNQDIEMGAHDLNILFCARESRLQLGKTELVILSRLGLKYISRENVPFWGWHSAVKKKDANVDIALHSLLSARSDEETIGALTVFRALGRKLPASTGESNEPIVERLLSNHSSPQLATAALAYLSRYGTDHDYPYVHEVYLNGDYRTSRSALECMVSIRHRDSTDHSAQSLILQSKFESLESAILDPVVQGLADLPTEELLSGLQHRCTELLMATLRILLDRGQIDDRTLETMFNHRDARVRIEVIRALQRRGRSFTPHEVEDLLLKKDRSDRSGRVHFDKYIHDDLMNRTESELTVRVDTSKIYDDAAYFARAEKFFKRYGDSLRSDIDDRFQRYVRDLVGRIEKSVPQSFSSEFLKVLDEIEDGYRKQLTRSALDILCKTRERSDLERIRSNLSEGYAGPSSYDAKYLAKHGEWNDIILISSPSGSVHEGTLSLRHTRQDFNREIAQAILEISRRDSVSMSDWADIADPLLAIVVNMCPHSRFYTITDEALFRLFQHESAQVRKATAMKVVLVLPRKRIRTVLQQHISADRFYYNVVHWLDAGASLSRQEARRVVHGVLE